jgi:hypothetical protein
VATEHLHDSEDGNSISPSRPALEARVNLAVSADSVWAFTDGKTTLSRIDPVQNKVVGEIRLPMGCSSVISGIGTMGGVSFRESFVH